MDKDKGTPDERDASAGGGLVPSEPGLRRREFVAVTALGLPALASVGCSDDAILGTESDATTGTDDGTTGTSEGSTGTTAETTDPTTVGTTTTGTTDPTTGTGTDTEDPEPEPVPFDPEAVPESTVLFPRTVLAGDMDTSSVTVAVFIADKTYKRLRVWQPAEDEGFVDLVLDITVTPDIHGFVKHRVEGLSPGEWYQYAFFDGGEEDDQFTARSLIGNVRTALGDEDEEPITIAFGSCVGKGTVLPDYVDPDNIQPFEWAISDMVEAVDLHYDLFVHLGDQGYMDQVWSAGGSYESYLAAWGAYHGGGFRKIYPRAGMLSSWDDHEVTDNGTVDPWTDDPNEVARIENAMRAYYRCMPIDAEVPEDRTIWRSVRWGKTVEVVVLDARYERTPEPDLRFMSDEQMDWLLDRLENSPCTFVCVATSKPYSHVRMLGSDYPGGGERWSGHPDDRQKIKDLVNARGIKNILWVTGDIHMCYFGFTDEEDMSVAGRMREVCCTSGNTNPLVNFLSNDQFDWKHGQPHMPVITFDPILREILIQLYAEDGTVTFETTLALDD